MNKRKMMTLLTCVVALLGCEDEVVVGQSPVAPNAVAPVAPPPVMPDASTDEESEAVVLSYVDDDFVELDVRNRDPFRRFVSVVRRGDAPQVQRQVIMPQTSIDEMRLIAIIGGIARPRAMLQDPSGVGFVVKKDDYIGREEVLQSGGSESMPVTLNWQVARIRVGNQRTGTSAEVVLTRADPTAPDRPPLTRVIPLYEEEDPSQRNLVTQ